MDLGKRTALYLKHEKQWHQMASKSHQMTPRFINQGMDMAIDITPPFPSSYVDAWRIKFSFVYSC